MNRILDWLPHARGGDGASLVGKHPKDDLPPIAKRFRKLLGTKGWTVVRLYEEAAKRFGEEAATPQSFRRLVTKSAPESDSKTVRQADAIFDGISVDEQPSLTIEQVAGDGTVMGAIAPLIGHIPAARDATEEQIVAESRKLMNSRHASLHALLTLLLTGNK